MNTTRIVNYGALCLHLGHTLLSSWTQTLLLWDATGLCPRRERTSWPIVLGPSCSRNGQFSVSIVRPYSTVQGKKEKVVDIQTGLVINMAGCVPLEPPTMRAAFMMFLDSRLENILYSYDKGHAANAISTALLKTAFHLIFLAPFLRSRTLRETRLQILMERRKLAAALPIGIANAMRCSNLLPSWRTGRYSPL